MKYFAKNASWDPYKIARLTYFLSCPPLSHSADVIWAPFFFHQSPHFIYILDRG